jgi:uncharacterized membrane protein YkoI
MPICLPLVALALGCAATTSDAAAGHASKAGWIAPDVVLTAGLERGGPRSLLRIAAEQREADEQADLPPGAKVTREQAASIALRAVAGEVTSVDVERKLGKIVYTVEIMTPHGVETDVFVDVQSGEVLGTD